MASHSALAVRHRDMGRNCSKSIILRGHRQANYKHSYRAFWHKDVLPMLPIYFYYPRETFNWIILVTLIFSFAWSAVFSALASPVACPKSLRTVILHRVVHLPLLHLPGLYFPACSR